MNRSYLHLLLSEPCRTELQIGPLRPCCSAPYFSCSNADYVSTFSCFANTLVDCAVFTTLITIRRFLLRAISIDSIIFTLVPPPVSMVPSLVCALVGQICVAGVWPSHTSYSGGSQVSGVMDGSPGEQRCVNNRWWRNVYLPHPSPCTTPPPSLSLNLPLHPPLLPEPSPIP